MRRKPERSDTSVDMLFTRARLAHESLTPVDSEAALQKALTAGENLNAAKARLPHGEWSTRLVSTKIPPSTARLYMQLARERERIIAAGCKSIREARRLLAGTKPRSTAGGTDRRGGRHGRPVSDRYEEGYADGYRSGRADGHAAQSRNGHGSLGLQDKDLLWLITLAHPDKHQGDLRATRVTQVLVEHRAQARQSKQRAAAT